MQLSFYEDELLLRTFYSAIDCLLKFVVLLASADALLFPFLLLDICLNELLEYLGSRLPESLWCDVQTSLAFRWPSNCGSPTTQEDRFPRQGHRRIPERWQRPFTASFTLSVIGSASWWFIASISWWCHPPPFYSFPWFVLNYLLCVLMPFCLLH